MGCKSLADRELNFGEYLVTKSLVILVLGFYDLAKLAISTKCLALRYMIWIEVNKT